MKEVLDPCCFKAKRIKAGKYEYLGFLIECIYDYPVKGRKAWQCIDKDGTAFGHSYTLKEAKRAIDEEVTICQRN